MTTIGYFGQLHPILKDKMKLNQEAFIFKIDIDAVISIIKETVPRFKHLPQFPEVKRDLAFVINQDVTYDDIQRVIKGGVQQNIFKGCEVLMFIRATISKKVIRALRSGFICRTKRQPLLMMLLNARCSLSEKNFKNLCRYNIQGVIIMKK